MRAITPEHLFTLVSARVIEPDLRATDPVMSPNGTDRFAGIRIEH
jgi:hypothetical protein